MRQRRVFTTQMGLVRVRVITPARNEIQSILSTTIITITNSYPHMWHTGGVRLHSTADQCHHVEVET